MYLSATVCRDLCVRWSRRGRDVSGSGVSAQYVLFPTQLSPLGIQALPLVYSAHSKQIGRTGDDVRRG